MPLVLTIEGATTLPNGAPVTIRMTEGQSPINIGCDVKVDWPLPDASHFISARHCEVRHFTSGFWLHDFSANGTFVNDNSQRLQLPYRLRHGDRIAIGPYIILVGIEEDVLICHSSDDEDTANAVCRTLEKAGIRCWIARRDMRSGRNRSEEIAKALDNCVAAVVIFSRSADNSDQLRQEFELTSHRSVPIIFFVVEDLPDCEELRIFFRCNWIEAFTAPTESHLVRLTSRVEAILGFKGDLLSHEEMQILARAPRPAGLRELMGRSNRLTHPNRENVVNVGVFGPQEALRGERLLFQVFIHDRDEVTSRILDMAKASDPSAESRGATTLNIAVSNGDRLDFILEAEGLELAEPMLGLVWWGGPQSCVFDVKVPLGFAADKAHVRVIVLRGAIPIGRIIFVLSINSAKEVSKVVAHGDVAKKFERVFLSYASPDRSEVLKRVQALRAARIEFFQDLLTLEPGDEWEPILFEEIDRCDLFMLFWSTAAKNSKWVMRETDHALRRRRIAGANLPQIVPVVIEGPPVPEPPPQLAQLHMNDWLTYVIAAEGRSGENCA